LKIKLLQDQQKSMVRIISMPNPRLALAFADYMATQKVTLTLKSEGHETQIWLEDESKLADVEKQLALFLENPVHPRYLAASWQISNTRVKLPYPHYSYLQRIRSQAGPLTLAIILLCIVIFVIQNILGDETVMTWLAWPEQGQLFQAWRYFTPSFMHFSLLHILFNLLWWWYLGGQVEKKLGVGKLINLTLIAALVSNWGQSIFSGADFGGLSGVVYGLMGYVWLTSERHPQGALSMPRGLMIFSVIWLIAGYFSALGLALANAAHTFGLVFGLAMAYFDTRQPGKHITRG
jgi:GlpG protein